MPLHVVDSPFDAIGSNRSLAEGDFHRLKHLVTIERLPRTGSFDHLDIAKLDPLVGRELLAALWVFAQATTACGSVVLRGPAVGDLGILGHAVRALHLNTPVIWLAITTIYRQCRVASGG